ncbi:MAG: hypothetical protein E7487_10470 [Ruminococcaceae bacterium]|nr:hypothetical protein [Oscillospiraceae bacterium]
MSKKIAILFNKAVKGFSVTAAHAAVAAVSEVSPFRCEVELTDEKVGFGAYQTRVTVRTDAFGFSFFLRDINAICPVFIPQYGVAVTDAADGRDYAAVAAAIAAKGGKSNLEKIEEAPETSFDGCIEGNRELKSYAWLGLSRDMRIFEVGIRDYCAEQWDCVTPRDFGKYTTNEEIEAPIVKYSFMTGRGIGCESNTVRSLEEGVLPILNSRNEDNDVVYDTQYFVTNEVAPLTEETVEGTDMLVADAYGVGHMLTPEQQEKADKLIAEHQNRPETTVMYIKVVARNTALAPRYAFVHLPDPLAERHYMKGLKSVPYYDGEKGFGCLPSGNVYLVAKLNGEPAPQNEMSILLQPDETVEYVFMIPHSPISAERAEALAKNCYAQRFEECKRFWQSKLEKYSNIHVPEQRIDEMIRAGMLHIDLGYFGKEPNGAVDPIVGVYTAIGSESSPGIQFLDSIANHTLAERALQYFVEKQHEDGFIQNFGGYMLETGFTLWSMGEHYRYTRDDEWAKRVAPAVIAACEYDVRWREQNLDESLRKRGYGMISGKVADPEDMFHSYMLNSGEYAGFVGASYLLENVDPEAAAKYRALAAECGENIRESLAESLIEAPVIPLGNGCWVPSFTTWTEYPGALSLYAEGGDWYSHATFTIRDILGAEYLPLHGAMDPNSLECEFMKDFWADYLCSRNVAFSQPYYSPHPYLNLRRGEVKAFLSEFYNAMSGLADRGTYSFWEHYFHASPHKLHEETWFLMRCRWMLWLEENADLRVFAGIPRAWMENGKEISAENVKSVFGTLSFKAVSDVANGKITATIKLEGNGVEKPERILVRLPHPDENIRAKSVNVGTYCSKCESVILQCEDKAVNEFEIELTF